MDEETRANHLEVVQKGFRRQFDDGDKLALLDCIRWCDDYDLPLPRWALVALSQVAGRYLERKKDTLDEALFGSRVRMGRLAHRATARRQSRKDQLIYDTVVALNRTGFQGGSCYDRARELLQTMCVDADNRLIFEKVDEGKVPQPETIKRKYERMKKAGVRPSGFAYVIPMMVNLGDAPRRGK